MIGAEVLNVDIDRVRGTYCGLTLSPDQAEIALGTTGVRRVLAVSGEWSAATCDGSIEKSVHTMRGYCCRCLPTEL